VVASARGSLSTVFARANSWRLARLVGMYPEFLYRGVHHEERPVREHNFTSWRSALDLAQ
jgi:hypothetical protein